MPFFFAFVLPHASFSSVSSSHSFSRPFLFPHSVFLPKEYPPTVHRRKRWEGCAKNTQSNHSISYRGTRLGDQKEREMKKRKKKREKEERKKRREK